MALVFSKFLLSIQKSKNMEKDGLIWLPVPQLAKQLEVEQREISLNHRKINIIK